ncbi:MAG: DUF348 domain-containing protein [Clostridiaceae bacterium]|jgi:uncharacterized protein YabE (DUF348 family)|nr:DUF348 domain-containing protein [Clostridiaceae bacterium]
MVINMVLDKEVNPHLTWRHIVFAVFALVIGAMSINGLVYAMSKHISIEDGNGSFKQFKTYKSTVAQVFAQQNIQLGEYDEANLLPDDRISDGSRIVINRAVVVNLIDGKDERLIWTAKQTAAEVLESQGIKPNNDIKLNVSLADKVFEGMTIKVIYSKSETLTTQAAIPYKVIKRVSNKLSEGQTRVACEGAEGLAQYVQKVIFENDIEVDRYVVEEKIITKPVDRVIEYAPATSKAVAYNSGTLVSRSGELRYKKVITCSASAYCIKGRTASGSMSQVGAVAVDPKVIPLGTRLYIEAPDGSWSYGNAVAADTGGSIKGNKVDLFMNTYQEAIQFGRRSAKVYILE